MKTIDEVVKNGFCIGCGACAALDSKLEMQSDLLGWYQARQKGPTTNEAQVCPFSDSAPDEANLASERFGAHATYHPTLGYYTKTYAGHVTEDRFRERGSSGGLGTWILYELLRRGDVDHVIHVKRSKNSASTKLFEYGVSSTLEDVLKGSKSRYYPVEMSGVLETVIKTSGRYAIVGLPCFIKAVRQMGRVQPDIQERIIISVSLFCGHLKSKGFAKLLGWQSGFHPDAPFEIDFRTKSKKPPASSYSVTTSGIVGGKHVSAVKRSRDLYGTNWGYGFFKHQACDYCDDVIGETADVSVGDAWLPEYSHDPLGTNVIVSRNPLIDAILKEASAECRLSLDLIDPQRVIVSQSGGYRHKREYLKMRISDRHERDLPVPKKRVEPTRISHGSQQRELVELRSNMRERSHTAFVEACQQNDLGHFMREMKPMTDRYDRLTKRSFSKRVFTRLGLILRRVKLIQ